MTRNRLAGLMARRPIFLYNVDKEETKVLHESREMAIHHVMQISLFDENTVLWDGENQKYVLENDAFVLISPSGQYGFRVEGQHNAGRIICIDFEVFNDIVFPDAPLKQKNISALMKQDVIVIPTHRLAAEVMLFNMIIHEFEEEDAFYYESILGSCTTLLIGLYRAYKQQKEELGTKSQIFKNPDQLNPAIDYINVNYYEDMKIGMLAAMCHMSESHFRRLFVDRMGMAPVEYINHQRVREACRLIDSNKYTMDEIATRCGFGNASTFYRNFKKIMGKSPLQWQKNIL